MCTWKGRKVYKFAVNAICTGVQEALEETGLSPEDIHHVLLHQANMRIIDAARKKLSIPQERYHCCIEETGKSFRGQYSHSAGSLLPGRTSAQR